MLEDVNKFEVQVLPGNMAPCLADHISSGESGTINSSHLLDAGGADRESVTLVLSLSAGPEMHNNI